MNKSILFVLLCVAACCHASAQVAKGLTLDEYKKAKTYVVKDLDNETYVKTDSNRYILERYEDRKPYFITGDDGIKKRIDLYSLSRKGEENPVGTLIYYTTEKGKIYTSCLPASSADAKVWGTYFEDIHDIDKTEKFFVLKLSYVLSKEFSFQQYKVSLKGKEPDRAEAGTYGNDICFPGTEMVSLLDGSSKMMKNIVPGDEVVTIDPVTGVKQHATVKKLMAHEASNYAITSLILLHATVDANEIKLSVNEVNATPNHPMMTVAGAKKIGAVAEGDQLLCYNKLSGLYEPFTVWYKSEHPAGLQQVFNIEASGGRTFVLNGVSVLQK